MNAVKRMQMAWAGKLESLECNLATDNVGYRSGLACCIGRHTSFRRFKGDYCPW